ncbi:hypothetical protein OSB04_009846 [Centaurea solstitialis]|uniref:Transmembrane protein n=1 Tax=Centaurea solstitialis TaxID=347529 RepID=A0AA38WBB4_9ASTR|nr:hypothetical protein OSB04_009846 [Centaurea solstitialis]
MFDVRISYIFRKTHIDQVKLNGKNGGIYDLVESWGRKRFLGDDDDEENNTSSSSSLVLAQERTTRKDPIDEFKLYKGGWNIKDRHYWAVVCGVHGGTVLGGGRSVVRGVRVMFDSDLPMLLLLPERTLLLFQNSLHSISCSPHPLHPYGNIFAFATGFVFFRVGCIVLYTGQGKFHQSSSKTLEYIVYQADMTAKTLQNVSEDLATAKNIAVAQVFLPVDVQADIDAIQTKLNVSAIELSKRTKENKVSIHNILKSVRIALIVISAVMLLWTFLGFMFSILGQQCMVYTLVLFGWVFVTVTLVLCGVFLCLQNVTADSCEAMHQWVENPTAHTTLDDILPCVDNVTAQETLMRSKEVTLQLANVINQVINNVTNGNFPPNYAPLYYNQSGPSMPPLCNPFNSDFSNRTCAQNEVPLSEASQVYSKYVCEVTPQGVCSSTGRLTPDSFKQMSAGLELSYSLYLYGPFLVELQDCTFVRQTFTDISQDHCRVYAATLTGFTSAYLWYHWQSCCPSFSGSFSEEKGDIVSIPKHS